MIQICTQKSTWATFHKIRLFWLKQPKITIDNHRLISHSIPNTPKGGDMVFGKSNNRSGLYFFRGAADLKKHVFINVRKQTRQKMEGVSASQF